MPETKALNKLQFSLRSLLLAMTLVAVFFGSWLPVCRHFEAARKRSEELARMRRKEEALAAASAALAAAEKRLELITAELEMNRANLRKALRERQQIDKAIWRFGPENFSTGDLPLVSDKLAPASADKSLRPQPIPTSEYWHRTNRPRQIQSTDRRKSQRHQFA